MRSRWMPETILAAMLAVGSALYGQSNAVPYQETFEGLAVGSDIIVPGNTNGWYSGTNTVSAFVTNVSYAWTNYPVESTTHSNVLKFTDASLTNRFAIYSQANTTVDFMAQAMRASAVPDSNLVAGSQTALYLDTNGLLNVRYGIDNTGSNNAWQQYTHTAVGTADWARITIEFDYITDPSNRFFRVSLNGTEIQPSTNGYLKGSGTFTADPNGTWLRSAAQATALQSFSASGSGMLDDLVVTISDYLLAGGVQGGNGTVTPASTNVLAGNSATFVVTASNYYRIATLTTNGTAVTGMSFDNGSTSTNFIWINVQAAGTVTVAFVAQVVTNPAGWYVPYEWLAGYGLTNYDADAVADKDLDGVKTWQEYIAGTVPTNAASVFKVAQAVRNVVTWSPVVTGRVYSVHWSTNLVKGFTELAGNATSPHTNTLPNSRVNHYQIKVRMQ
jgi:hypothetical protein